MRRTRWPLLLAAAALACRVNDQTPLVPGGSIAAGKTAVQQYSCGACHEIHGVPGADGRVGPSLNGIVHRTLIGGELPNTVANIAAWIRDPQAVEPRSGMPNLGVTETAARDIVAYLYTLH